MEDDSSIDSMCKQLDFDEEVHLANQHADAITFEPFHKNNLTEKQLQINGYIDKVFSKWEEDIKQKYFTNTMPPKRKKSTTNTNAKKSKTDETVVETPEEVEDTSNERGWGAKNVQNGKFVNRTSSQDIEDESINGTGTDTIDSVNTMNVEDQLIEEGMIAQSDDVDFNTEGAGFNEDSPTGVTDLINMSRQDLISTIERLQADVERLKTGGMKEKRKKKVPSPQDKTERVLLKELMCVLRNEVLHKIAIQPKNWELYHTAPNSMCQIVMRGIEEWPAAWDEKKKEKVWNDLLGPNLNRKWSVVKNEVVQKIRHVFYSK